MTTDAQILDDFVGTKRFLVLQRLGAGGMGVVYEAVDRERNARVALKTLRTLKPDAILRFKNEFRALSDLHHPNLVSLGELFEEQEQWFFTMEMVRGLHFLDYVRGGDRLAAAASSSTASEAAAPEAAGAEGAEDMTTLHGPSDHVKPAAGRESANRLASGVDEGRLRSALAQLALGLAALHGAHKVHRDIKPSNILVTAEGRVVLLDFGLVADLDNSLQESHLVGTFSYMAPEQAGLKPVGPAADWYSVGVLLFHALTGRLPVQGQAREMLILKQAFEPPLASSITPDVPADLDQLAAELLRIDPQKRPSEREILRRLGAEQAEAFAPERHFVGRRTELEALRHAFTAVRRGRGVTMVIHGESGVGKSALTRRFAESIVVKDSKPIVLTGRCYERESVPYKAVDGVIDALSRYLTTLPDDDLKRLLPRQRGLVGQVFPVMRRIEAIAEAPRPMPGQLDPQIQRTRLFFALRDLFTRLAEQRPVVLMIDDLQWADADSLALLAEITRAPSEPHLLLVATMRTALKTEIGRGDGENARSVEQIAAMFTGDVRCLHLSPLPHSDAQNLVDVLLQDAGTTEPVSAAAVAEAAGGHPLFIDELVRRLLSVGAPEGPLRLEEALRYRIDRLALAARQLLELVAVAGAPLEQETAARAARVEFRDFVRQAALLRAQNLVRTGGARRTDTVEPYHDRVREAVLTGLNAATRTAWHARIAVALEGAPRADPEALAIHWRGAQNLDKAAEYALRAAGEAADALAFDRAARLYQLTLELRPRDGPAGGAIRAKLGDALANAGRGAEAAAAYLAAAEALPAEALDLRRRAADQLLRSGHIDAAMATLRTVLSAIGMDLPETPRSALVSFLFRRTQVRLRGLSFRERSEREIPAEDLTRIDTCWSVSAGLGLVDTIVGSYFQARGLLLALDAGEPIRIARALAMEASYSSAAGGESQERTAMLLRATHELSNRIGQPYVLGWASGADGIAASLEGRWKTGHEACERAEALFRDRCTGVAWEIVTMRWFSTWSLAYLGGLAELSRRVPVRMREAKERGDLYAVICLSTGLANMVWLAEDNPTEARERCREATVAWSQRKFHVENWWSMCAERQIDLYVGDAEAAHRGIEEQWPELSGSMLLMVQATRIEALHLRARSALMLATLRARDRKELCRAAQKDTAKIEKERMLWSLPSAALLRAGIAETLGSSDRALALLAEAAAGFDQADMALYAAAARYRRGQLLGGDEGRELRDKADAWMASQGVFNRARMVAMLAPGFQG